MTQAMFAQDSRSLFHRIRRYSLYRIAKAAGIQYPEGAPKNDMIRLLEAHGVDPMKYIQMVPYEVRDRAGNLLGREMYPIEEAHASARNGVDAAQVVGEKLSKKAEEEAAFEASRMAALRRDNEQLKRENEQLKELTERRLAALEGMANAKPKSNPDSPQARYWAAYRKARDMGLPVQRQHTRKEIENMIDKAEGNADDENTA